MKVYHGTSSTRLPSIFSRGIRPRGSRPSLPGVAGSRDDAVYLTTTFPLAYAVRAMECDKYSTALGAVIEVDTDRLDAKCLVPDEAVAPFALAAAFASGHASPDLMMWMANASDIDMLELGKAMLPAMSECANDSLALLGTCAHMGSIPPHAISRVAVFNPKKAGALFRAACETTATIEAYRSQSQMLASAIAWLFGEPCGGFHFGEREGVTIVDHCCAGKKKALAGFPTRA